MVTAPLLMATDIVYHMNAAIAGTTVVQVPHSILHSLNSIHLRKVPKTDTLYFALLFIWFRC